MPSDSQNASVVENAEATVQNPNAIDPAAKLNALKNLPKPAYFNKEIEFSFKSARKADYFEKDADGKYTVPKTDDKTGEPIKMPEKRKSFKLNIPMPTWDGLVDALANEKTRDYVLGVLNDEVYSAAREQIDRTPEDSGMPPVNSQEELDISKLTLDYLANLPPSLRRGGGISTDVWNAFAADYVEVITANTQRKPDRIALAAKMFLARLQPVRQDKELIQFLLSTLDMWAEKTENLDEFKAVYEFLMKKGDEFINAENKSRLDALV